VDRVSFINHKGKQILHINMAECKAEETMAVIKTARGIIGKQAPGSVLTLTNATNTRFNDEVNAALKEYVQHNKQFVKAAAVVGVTGLRQIVYNAAMRFSGRTIIAFDDAQQAMDWLSHQ